ncbi:hypothetical protein CC80DRAFT_488105 [Byssothecium circinans]|uniref:F-box domain-containing protein n=1 Tax=Byssothecium circinans TaxID=147558 RepID=A0A6A5UAB9_9PLEO|nr:hypothetical protein CC80DRAFT_488105 [Byssothecium circinans]
MTSHIPSLLDLPFEIFKTILAESVRLRGLMRALRLRLVNKLFSDELVEALCVSKVIDECWVELSK